MIYLKELHSKHLEHGVRKTNILTKLVVENQISKRFFWSIQPDWPKKVLYFLQLIYRSFYYIVLSEKKKSLETKTSKTNRFESKTIANILAWRDSVTNVWLNVVFHCAEFDAAQRYTVVVVIQRRVCLRTVIVFIQRRVCLRSVV